MRTMNRIFTVLVLVIFGVGCAATSMRRSFNETWRDEATKTAVKLSLSQEKTVKARYINVDVYRNVVTLHGRVETAEQKVLAEQIAAEGENVVMVENHLVVRTSDDPRFVVREQVGRERAGANDAVYDYTATPRVVSDAPLIGARRGARREASSHFVERDLSNKATKPQIATRGVEAPEAEVVEPKVSSAPIQDIAAIPVRTEEPAAQGPAKAVSRPRWFSAERLDATTVPQPDDSLAQEAAAELERLKASSEK